MKKSFIILAMLPLLIACQKQNSGTMTEISLPASESALEGDFREVPYEMYRPSKMYVAGEQLIVFDDVQTGCFKIFSLPDFSQHYTFGSIGGGPDEFASVDKEYFNVEGSDLTIFSRDRLYRYGITDSACIRKAPDGSPEMLQPSSDNPINSLKSLGNRTYVCDNDLHIGNQEFRLLKPESDEQLTFGDLTQQEVEMDEPQKGPYFAKALCANPALKRFAAFYYFRPVFKIFSNEGTLLQTVKINLPDGKQTDYQTIFFTEPYSTSRHIYVLWVGKSKQEVGSDISSFRPDLLVFDWEGNLQHRITLNKPVITFAVSEATNRLYAVSFAEEDFCRILQFPLPADE